VSAAVLLRDVVPADLADVLRLNTEWEHVTSPLDASALDALHAQAAYFRVADLGSQVAAFLLAVGPGASYDSPNYRWFDARGGDFLYIDRVVVSSAFHRVGLGGALYDDVLAFAAGRGIPRLVCEVDVEPLNVPSDAFHRRRSFVEVGTQWVSGGNKRVSLRELAVR
jgi:predicted GNAT superfamily acetyltransferase